MRGFAFQLICVVLVFACSAIGIHLLPMSGVGSGTSSDVGRGLYISEGCINCHSQYAREGTLDTKIWGLATAPPIGGDTVVLIGNRRQGPDLSNIGARRSREWNRAHLMNPSALAPGSRMPSYAHLFQGGHGQEDGEALLSYLDTLVAGDPSEWWNYVFGWQPLVGSSKANVRKGELSFATQCAPCHGVDGKGGGRAAALFASPPRDLVSEPYRFTPDSMDASQRWTRLAQILKFGIAGTSMPGHESLTDDQIVDLLSYLETLREVQPQS